MTRRRSIYTVLGIVVLGAVLAVGTTSYTSVCGKCGMARDSVSVFGLRHHELRPSPLSKAVEQNRLRRGHTHEWLFCTGSNVTVMCMIGPGLHLTDVAQSEHAAAFLRNLVAFDPEKAELWLDALLGGRGNDVAKMLDTFPEAGFATREDFDAWRKKAIDGAEEWFSPRSR
jgi:hypothetical protein